ncbi:cyclin-dependent kinase inhibitor 3 family protein [Enterovibrio norvegicus]|uniref:cyclin-dependent kinase inhibitor 3 family protein n=1 Tax=Enterovibrio norvegicus TaxID=188144 RepID=UPI00354F5B24
MTHPTWELPVEKGALILTPCPGTKGEGLTESLEQLQRQGATVIVTAINHEEMADKNVAALGEETQRLGMQWFHVPIEDDCAPAEDFQNNWKASREALHQAIENGNKVVMHCMGGSGRTGLLAAHLLLERNWTLEEIVRDVQALRPGAFTKPLQVEYIGTLVK